MSSFPADELHHFSSWVETGNQLLSYWCLVGDGWVDGGLLGWLLIVIVGYLIVIITTIIKYY